MSVDTGSANRIVWKYQFGRGQKCPLLIFYTDGKNLINVSDE